MAEARPYSPPYRTVIKPYGRALVELARGAERRHIEAVLQATAGNQTQAAVILGIERKTLARKMKRLGIR